MKKKYYSVSTRNPKFQENDPSLLPSITIKISVNKKWLNECIYQMKCRLVLTQHLKDNLLYFFCAVENDDHILLVITLRMKLKKITCTVQIKVLFFHWVNCDAIIEVASCEIL